MNTHRSAYFVGLLWVTVPCAVIPVEASPPSSYYVTDLGSLGGAYTYGIGINASGQVSGYSYISGDPFAGGEFHAFLWTPTTSNGVSGAMQDLGTLGGSFSNGYGINDSGQVSGYYLAESYHAFLWSPTTHNGTIGTMSDLGAGIGLGISDSGRVAGAVYDEVGGSNAVLYDGVTRFLGTLGGAVTVGNDVNARGQVTGYSETLTDATEHAFLWSPATPNGTTGSMSDLGAGIAIGINNVGQVTGRTGRAGFLWTPTTPNGGTGTMASLGTLGDGAAEVGVLSEGHGINNKGHVTGGYATGAENYHAFIYTSDSGMVDLNSLIDPLSGWELQYGAGINDAGQITGQGRIGGVHRAFLLTPVPEPATFAIFALGVITLALRRRRTTAMVLFLSCALSAANSAQAARYAVTTLGRLGSFGPGHTTGLNINDTGQVVGESGNRAFLYDHGAMYDLGTIGGTGGRAYGISASGQVSG